MLKGAVLLVAALALVEGASLGREYECTRGVEYWCSSVEAAEECGAAEYCTQHVWAKEEGVGDSSLTCATCEWVASEALKMLDNESTKEEILSVLEGLCDKIPFVGAECHKYVAEMGPSVIDILEGMVSADTICQTLKLCTVMENFDMENDFVKYLIGPQLGDDKCTMCVDGLKELQVILKDKKLLDVIEVTTTLFCTSFPLPQCQSLMEKYIKEYIDTALQWDVNAECVRLKSCGSHTDLIVEDNLTEVVEDVEDVAGTPECDACIDGVKELKKVWGDEDTQALVKMVVNEICTVLGVPEATCTMVSSLILPQITSVINSLDPKETCVKIGACTSELGSFSDDSFPCEFCEFLGEQGVKRLFNNHTENVLINTAKKVCSVVPLFSKECSNAVDQYGTVFLNKLKNTNFHYLCGKFMLCDPEVQEWVKSLSVYKAITSQESGNEECDACMDGIDEIKEIFTDDDTQALVHVAIEALCDSLHPKIPTCEKVLKMAFDGFLMELAKVDNQDICAQYGMCPSDELTAVSDDSFTCRYCEFIGTEVIKRTFNNETEAIILGYAKQICAKIPSFIGNECSALVDEYGQYYLGELKKVLDVEHVCENLHLCNPAGKLFLETSSIVKALLDPEMFALAKETFPCDVCMFVGDEFVERVLTYDTVTKVLAIARKTCAYVPLFSEECTTFIDESGEDQMYKWISYININNLCSKIHLCHPSNKTVSTFPSLPDQLKGFICDSCQFFGHEFIDRLLTNNTIEGTMNVARKVCSVVPLYSQECIHFIDTQGFYWLNLWISELDADNFCNKLTLCPIDGPVAEAAELSPVDASIQCDTCMFVGNEFVEKAFTEDNIQITLGLAKVICSKVPVFSKECIDFIESDGNELIHTLISYVHVDQICSMIHACPAKDKTVSSFPHLPDQLEGFICDTCEFFGHEFIDRLLTNKTREKTLDIARKSCAYVPLYSAECQKFIDDDGDYFLQIWISNLNVDRFCSKIKLCKPKTPLVEESVAESLGLTASIQCDVCMFVGNEFVEKALTDDTIGFALMLAHEACAYVPLFAKECMEAVEQDGDKLIRMAFSHIHVDQICSEIHLCPALLEETLPNPSQGFVCDTCQFFGHEFVERVLTKETRAKTLDVVRAACGIVPLYSEECKAAVDKHGNYYINMWIDQMDMDGLCMKLKLCTPAFKTWYETSPIPQLINEAKMPDCTTCVEGFDELKKIIHDPYTKDLVVVLTRQACLSLPIPFCNSVMSRVVAHIEAAVDAINSKGECTKLGQCPGVTETDDAFNIMIASLTPVSEGMCDTCVEGLEEMKEMLNDPTIKVTIRYLAEQFCTYAPMPATMCNYGVDSLVDMVLERLAKIDSQGTCSFFGVCSARPIDVTGSYCDDCVEGLDEFKEIFADPLVKDSMHLISEEICTEIPIPGCSMILNKIFDYSIDKLAGIDSKGACSFFGVCSAKPIVEGPFDGICETCVEGFEEMKELVTDPEVKGVIKSMVGEICQTLPIPMCQYILDSYIDTLISTVAAIDSNSTCAFLGACDGDYHNAGDVIKSLVSTFPGVSAGPCDLCTESVDEIKEMVSDQAVIDVAKEAVDEVCAMIPLIGETCKTTLETYIDEAVEIVLKMDTKTICIVMGMC